MLGRLVVAGEDQLVVLPQLIGVHSQGRCPDDFVYPGIVGRLRGPGRSADGSGDGQHRKGAELGIFDAADRPFQGAVRLQGGGRFPTPSALFFQVFSNLRKRFFVEGSADQRLRLFVERFFAIQKKQVGRRVVEV